MHRGREHTGAPGAPMPLLIGFALFVLALGYMVASSLARREAIVFAPTATVRSRPADWSRRCDTITIDATDGTRWRRASLTLGRPLSAYDTAPWEIAARRYRITVAGALADLGTPPFERAAVDPSTRFVPSTSGEIENEAIHRWYRYSLVTHLLTPNGHVYALRTPGGRVWKLQPLGYYCPGLVPGCVTVRYALLDRGAASSHIQGSSPDGP